MPVSDHPRPSLDEDLLTVEEAAKRLRLSVSILNKWRVSGAGPAFLKIGRSVRYAVGDLDAWADSKRRVSTSQRQAA